MRLGYLWVVMLILLSKRSSVSEWRASSYSYIWSVLRTFIFPWGNLTSTVKGYYYQPGQCHEKCWILPPCSSFPFILMGTYSHILLYGHIENNFCVLYKTQDEEIHYILRSQFEGLCVIFQLYFSPGERLCLIRIYVSIFTKAARELQAKFSFQMCLLLHCRHLTKQYSPIKNFRAASLCKNFFNGDQF